jgi:uncharacterized protein YceK
MVCTSTGHPHFYYVQLAPATMVDQFWQRAVVYYLPILVLVVPSALCDALLLPVRITSPMFLWQATGVVLILASGGIWCLDR